MDKIIGFLNPCYDLFTANVLTAYLQGGEEKMKYILNEASIEEVFERVSV